jgi:hypothetical protein
VAFAGYAFLRQVFDIREMKQVRKRFLTTFIIATTLWATFAASHPASAGTRDARATGQSTQPGAPAPHLRYFPWAVTSSASAGNCPIASGAHFVAIPVESAVNYDRPPGQHPDVNLSLRGFTPTPAPLTLVDYGGDTDPDAPRLYGLLGSGQMPALSGAYQVHGWNWGPDLCNGDPLGCRGTPIPDYPVTAVGFASTPGQPVYPPPRRPEVYGGGYKTMVLFADATRITLVYTRRDSPAFGYVIHIDNVCVDPNLLTLYHAQNDAQGYRATGNLPALHDGESLGTAAGNEVQVSVRDTGSFLDPRSRKDWWQKP